MVNPIRSGLAALAFVAIGATSASGAPLGLFDFLDQSEPSRAMSYAPTSYAPTPYAPAATEHAAPAQSRFKRQVVNFPTGEAPGTIVIDTPNTYLYLVLGQGKAMRYGIGVGREGFTWSGVKTVDKKAEWPDWTPPPEMLDRQPYLPRFMAGGPGKIGRAHV